MEQVCGCVVEPGGELGTSRGRVLVGRGWVGPFAAGRCPRRRCLARGSCRRGREGGCGKAGGGVLAGARGLDRGALKLARLYPINSHQAFLSAAVR
jgi:hypothetical protein